VQGGRLKLLCSPSRRSGCERGRGRCCDCDDSRSTAPHVVCSARASYYGCETKMKTKQTLLISDGILCLVFGALLHENINMISNPPPKKISAKRSSNPAANQRMDTNAWVLIIAERAYLLQCAKTSQLQAASFVFFTRRRGFSEVKDF